MATKRLYALALGILIAIPVVAQTSKTPQAGQSAQRSQRARFAGKWEVGTGMGNSTFYITLDSDGTATKSMGSGNGKWEVVGEEARISWEDGWHDVIRRAGNRYEKVAYAPGQSFNESPNNITSARRMEPM